MSEMNMNKSETLEEVGKLTLGGIPSKYLYFSRFGGYAV